MEKSLTNKQRIESLEGAIFGINEKLEKLLGKLDSKPIKQNPIIPPQAPKVDRGNHEVTTQQYFGAVPPQPIPYGNAPMDRNGNLIGDWREGEKNGVPIMEEYGNNNLPTGKYETKQTIDSNEQMFRDWQAKYANIVKTN